jgi:single-stranded-DNA-specific exonuclease
MIMKKWIVAEKSSDDIIEQLLCNRGISSANQNVFLNPKYDTDLHNPKLLDGIEKAADRILETISGGKKIGVIADYDADGVPGAALLHDILVKVGAKDIFTLIPLRSDGYGLTTKGIDQMIEEKIDLAITIDLGITAKKEVEYAKKKGLEMIITDHHEIQKDFLISHGHFL